MARRTFFLFLPVVGSILFAACSSGTSPVEPTPDAAPQPTTTGTNPPPPPPPPPTDGGSRDAADAADAAEPEPPPVPKQIRLDKAVSVDGYLSDVFTWIDSRGKPRSAALVRNDRRDPSNYTGGYLRQLTYEKANGTAMVVKGGRSDHPGWGYTINHLKGTGDLWSSLYQFGTYRQVLSGPHHAIHEFSFDAVGWPNGPVTIVIHWFFTTGHDHPVWSVTFDMTRAPPNMLDSDDRSPYGDLTFEGGTNGTVDGVGWGDKYKFVTTSAGPVTKSSTWDYSQPNRVPYVHMWNDASDSEMGNVQTIDFASKDAGGTWFYDNWGRTSANKVVGPGAPANQTMPVSWNWPFQLNQYEVDFGETRSKRMAWGLRRGAVGSTSYSGYGDQRQLSGYPYQSHSNVLVLGAKSEGAVAAEVAEIEASMDTTFDVVKGAVRTAGPEGIARTASAPYAVAGWSPVYGAWQLDADAAGAVEVTMNPGGAGVHRPVLVIHGYTGAKAPDTITFGGATLNAHSDFYPTLQKATRTLWITIDRDVLAPTAIAVQP
jgi:hypothetical protein